MSPSETRETTPPPLGSGSNQMENTETMDIKENGASAPTYPSNKKRIIIMAALYLAIFLLTLVWFHYLS